MYMSRLLKGAYKGEYYRAYEGDTRVLDYGSYIYTDVHMHLGICRDCTGFMD